MTRQALRIVLGLVLGLGVAAAWPSAAPPARVSWPQLAALGPGAVQDEASGRLREVVVHCAPEMGEALAAVYSDLFAELEPDTTVRVVCERREDLDGLASRLSRPPRARLVSEPVGHPVSGWAKDRFVAWRPARHSPPPRLLRRVNLGDGGPAAAERCDGGTERCGGPEVVLLAGPEPLSLGEARLGDWRVPGELATASNGRMRRVELPLELDGGDFAAADDCVLAAWTLMTRNPWLAGLGPRGAEEALSALAGRPVLLLGKEPGDVPEHHANMFALPVGGGRVLVGDARLAERILGREELAAAGILADFSAESAARLDRAAARLSAGGFRVTRLPAVPLDGARPYSPYVTYTNALLESFPDGRRRVYLPTYGLTALDRAAAEAWRALGFEVRPVKVASVWRAGGTLDCLVGVLRRGA